MRSIGVAAVVIVVALAGCTSGGELTAPTATTAPTTSPVASTARTTPPSTSPTASSAATTPPTSAPPRTLQQILAAMPEAERVGQLFMVGAASTGTDQAAITAITRYHVGAVILMGQGPTSIARTADSAAGLQRH
jgi:beta-N-acetylhexosaminidase